MAKTCVRIMYYMAPSLFASLSFEECSLWTPNRLAHVTNGTLLKTWGVPWMVYTKFGPMQCL